MRKKFVSPTSHDGLTKPQPKWVIHNQQSFYHEGSCILNEHAYRSYGIDDWGKCAISTTAGTAPESGEYMFGLNVVE